MPKKMRHGALRSALSERVREGKVTLVDGWSLEKPKTKEFVGALKQLGYEGKTVKELEDLLGGKKEAGSAEESEEQADVAASEATPEGSGPKRTRKAGVKTAKPATRRKKEAA
jgi:hypothetical protein